MQGMYTALMAHYGYRQFLQSMTSGEIVQVVFQIEYQTLQKTSHVLVG